MSLVVWLPLTKDLRQQGLKSYTITQQGNPTWVSGKLGKAMRFGTGSASTNGLSLNSNLVDLLAGNYSVAVWVCPYGNHYHYNGTIFSSGNWNSTCYAFGISQDNSQVDILCRGYNTYLTCSVPTNTWTHLCCTRDANNIVKLYKNGIYVGESQRSNIPASDATNACIGRETYADGYFTFNGSINDFRIYDHCLSPMEVKELAKGLVLHYPLNRQGWGQENLDNFRSYANNWTMESLSGSNYTDSTYGNVIKLTTSAANQRMYHNVTSTLWQSGQVYTVSFLAKADVNGRTCNMSRSIADFSPTFTLTTNWKRYSGQITSTATPGGGTLSFRIIQSGATVYITQIKLEKGEIATPYCPGSTDPDYTTMGLNSTTEYDCSGFCNNGTRTGTFAWTSNTPKYTVSTKFNGTDNAIQTPSLPTMITDKNYTIAVWIYKTVIGSKGYQTIYGGPSGFEIEARNGSANETKFVPWNWGKPMASYELNEWNHCVFVHSDADCKIYLNGEYIATGTAKASNPTGNYFVGAWNTATQQNFDGLMSDFRIYATALSASDVKSLYQNSAYIDSSGNVYGAVHSEV